MPDRLPYVVEPMTLDDLDQVMKIEKACFPTPWSRRAYRYEITENEHSTMLVVRLVLPPDEQPGGLLRHLRPVKLSPALGYGGFWMLIDEAHISTIAVHPGWRGRGLGELLLLSLLEQGAEASARKATLEVRVSNVVAQSLYQKYGFEIVSLRKRYYADNNEDAYIMATPSFETPEFQTNLHRCRTHLHARLRVGESEAAFTILEQQTG